jgi:uncharacterized membrane protein
MDATTTKRDEGDALLRKRTVRVLETGFRIAVLLLAIGLLLAAIRRDALPHEFGSPGDVLSEVFDGTPAGFLGLGIAAIILTPLAATITIMASFLQQGDRRYALITGAVVVILLASLSLSAL